MASLSKEQESYNIYSTDQVRLMAVVKNRAMTDVKSALNKYGIDLIGESRWQEAKDRIHLYPESIEKHFIGHLQTNKVVDVVAVFDCVETVDSLKLAEKINQAAINANKVISIYIQINISEDNNKYGFTYEESIRIFPELKKLSNITIDGIMTITAQQKIAQTRVHFKQMKELQEKLQVRELSMGMSTDWKVAIEEGATIVRVGRDLFE
ncbi:MAG: YggS family pyridoxal phosphate-dependent enzyme [bacterium]|nr:YggS family pyridoxal phosphate-dependent enzyme [bacterium]